MIKRHLTTEFDNPSNDPNYLKCFAITYYGYCTVIDKFENISSYINKDTFLDGEEFILEMFYMHKEDFQNHFKSLS